MCKTQTNVPWKYFIKSEWIYPGAIAKTWELVAHRPLNRLFLTYACLSILKLVNLATNQGASQCANLVAFKISAVYHVEVDSWTAEEMCLCLHVNIECS